MMESSAERPPCASTPRRQPENLTPKQKKRKQRPKQRQQPPPPTKGVPQTCAGCGGSFPSKNELFKHLRVTGGRCLGEEAHHEFLRQVVNHESNLEKIAVLYGYVPSDHYLRSEDGRFEPGKVEVCAERTGVRGGDHASALVVESIKYVSLGGRDEEDQRDAGDAESSAPAQRIGEAAKAVPSQVKVNRSYASASRGCDAVAQDAHTGAATEVCCARAPPLIGGDDEEERKRELQRWMDDVNAELERRVGRLKEEMLSNEEEIGRTGCGGQPPASRFPGNVRVFGRLSVNKKFNAEIAVTSRRMEYLLPLDFLVPTNAETNAMRIAGSDGNGATADRQSYFDSFTCFEAGFNPNVNRLEGGESTTYVRPAPNTRKYLYKLKKIMQSLSTHVVELDETDEASVLEKEFNRKSRNKQKRNSNRNSGKEKEERKRKNHVDAVGETRKGEDGSSEPTPENVSAGSKKTKRTTHVLRRKRYHNFSPGAMAHEFLTFRRLDRFYHRATIRFEQDMDGAIAQKRRPYVLLSLTGDQWLNGQARSVIGLFIAICRGYIDEDIIDCIFDEEYTNLVPAPPSPRTGLYAAEAMYMTYEGKLKMILSARHCDTYDRGFNDEAVIGAVEEWVALIQAQIARAWCSEGFSGDDGRLLSEKRWIEDYLEPWGIQARAQLADYRRWKDAGKRAASSATDSTIAETLLPPLDSVDGTVPQLFEKVLRYLREADASGLWPTTTPKRQLVMVSTKEDGSAASKSLSAAHMKAKSNKEERSSAYSFLEGNGGASGSFSVGAMPGEQCEQPKGNTLFPELMKAAFELEIALCPNREPSSTIAVNRNAQFRPHTDSGAGAGQSTSLIVGLGKYVGGELMVEGERKDIRFKAIEFNGWTQRHWTLPFRGERYSLVWFTPKGCEGIRGIDLCK